MAFNLPRLIFQKFNADSQKLGEGTFVRECNGSVLGLEDPFPMFYCISVEPPGGISDRPYRGFETVTYVLKGAIEYQDLEGRSRTLEAGDVKWMTAGKGIIHSEMAARQGTNIAVQLWVNLPADEKMIKPSCVEVKSVEIPTSTSKEDGVHVRVLAGSALGAHSLYCTHIPITFLDVTLDKGAEFHQGILASQKSFVYVIEGKGVFSPHSPSPVESHTLLVLSPNPLGLGDGPISVRNMSPTAPLRFLLIAGEPLNEPVERYLSFVMNTKPEIMQAVEDYRQHQNGL